MRFRIASLNVQNRPGENTASLRRRMAKLASLILASDPDAVCLQEVLPEGYPILIENLDPLESIFCPREDGQSIGEGVPLFLLNRRFSIQQSDRFWLSPTPDVPSVGWKARCHRVVGILGIQHQREGSRLIQLVNVHLDHRSRIARGKSLDLLNHRMGEYPSAAEREVVLCGDFNMRPRDPLIRKLQHTPPRFFDSALSSDTAASTPTFHGWGPLRLGRGRIDYLFHTSGLRCVDYRILPATATGRRISDHNLIVADFQLKHSERESTC